MVKYSEINQEWLDDQVDNIKNEGSRQRSDRGEILCFNYELGTNVFRVLPPCRSKDEDPIFGGSPFHIVHQWRNVPSIGDDGNKVERNILNFGRTFPQLDDFKHDPIQDAYDEARRIDPSHTLQCWVSYYCNIATVDRNNPGFVPKNMICNLKASVYKPFISLVSDENAAGIISFHPTQGYDSLVIKTQENPNDFKTIRYQFSFAPGSKPLHTDESVIEDILHVRDLSDPSDNTGMYDLFDIWGPNEEYFENNKRYAAKYVEYMRNNAGTGTHSVNVP